MPSVRQAGFTLIELMVTLVVLAILVALGLPSFQGSLRSNRVATATNEMIASLSLARSEAIRSTRGAGVCSSTDGIACGGDWNDGWLVWADTNSNSALDDGETVLRFSQGIDSLTAIGPENEVVAFDSRGRRRAAGDQSLTLRPSECDSRPLQRTLTINASGQIKTAREECP